MGACANNGENEKRLLVSILASIGQWEEEQDETGGLLKCTIPVRSVRYLICSFFNHLTISPRGKKVGYFQRQDYTSLGFVS